MYRDLKCWKMSWILWCFVIDVLLLGHIGQAQIPTYDVHLKDLLRMQKGLGWPSTLLVAKGQEALMKLTVKLDDQQSCSVTTPDGETFDVSSPQSSRFEKWGDGCGLRLRQVAMTDLGRWRLTATGPDSKSITGWTELNVIDDNPTYTAPPISLRDGDTQTEVELTSLDNSYCLVAQPFSESSLVAGHCRVTLDRTTRAVQGNWNVLIGLPGQISEVRVQRQVAVQSERLDVGFRHDTYTNKIHLYCNILHTSKNITFCRFQKTTNSIGFNIMEGLSDGTHSYYGEGFVNKQCGMTIETPTSQDYGTWRCSVGSVQWVGNTQQQQTPMQALISVVDSPRSQRSLRDVRSVTEEDRTVFVQEDMSFSLTCRAETSLSYCWFLHPNGSQFSPVARTSDNQLFWYSGENLQTGDCGITFSHANTSDAGDWVCHMGLAEQMGAELTDHLTVRVTGPLAATKRELIATVGQSATLLCHTANGNRPLDYCRFLSPSFIGITIDSSITQNNTIMDRFYFMPERSLDYGDCSLVITSVQPEDIGTWTCAARINNDDMESSDTIELLEGDLIDNLRVPLSQAGVIGMTVGLSALVVLLAGVVWYRIGKPIPWRKNYSSDRNSGMPFDLMSMDTTTTPIGARSSGSSVSTNSDNGSVSTEVEINMRNREAGSSQASVPPRGHPLESGNP